MHLGFALVAGPNAEHGAAANGHAKKTRGVFSAFGRSAKSLLRKVLAVSTECGR
jgi:hypothetical protein